MVNLDEPELTGQVPNAYSAYHATTTKRFTATMSRGPGVTQRFILAQLSELSEDGWLSVRELIERYAKYKNVRITHSLDCAIRNSCRRLADPGNPRVKLKRVDGEPSAQLTELQRLRQDNPWELKRREMAETWVSILAEQSREIRRSRR